VAIAWAGHVGGESLKLLVPLRTVTGLAGSIRIKLCENRPGSLTAGLKEVSKRYNSLKGKGKERPCTVNTSDTAGHGDSGEIERQHDTVYSSYKIPGETIPLV
jgi:hypothetical protein